MTRYAAMVLWFALAARATWVILNVSTLHRSPRLDVLGGVILVSFAAFAALDSPTGMGLVECPWARDHGG